MVTVDDMDDTRALFSLYEDAILLPKDLQYSLIIWLLLDHRADLKDKN